MTLTPAQRRLLQRIAQAEAAGTPLHVSFNLGGVSSGTTVTDIDALLQASLVTLGPHFVPLRGRPLTLTDAGRAALAPTTPTTADELRAAAAKLREMAKGTTRGPWFVADCELYPRWILSSGQTEPDSHYAADVAKSYPDGGGDGVYVTDADWAWMAFAHPGLAEPLAAWLEDTAANHTTYTDQIECPNCGEPGACNHPAEGIVCARCLEPEPCRCIEKALAVARVINRSHHA